MFDSATLSVRSSPYHRHAALILERQPNPLTTTPLDRIIRKCLANDLDDRFQSACDLKYNLTLAMEQDQPSQGQKKTKWPWAIAAACLLLAIAAWSPWFQNTKQPVGAVWFDVNPPEGWQFGLIAHSGGSSISPDGRNLAFVATSPKGETLLFIRPLGSADARALPGTQYASRPFWSPDSKSLAFVAAGKLKRVDVAGGSPTTLCDARQGRGGTWSEQGVILFGDVQQGLQRIPASGGTPSVVTQLNNATGQIHHHFPQFLPGGKDFLFLILFADSGKSGIFHSSLDGGPASRLLYTEHKAVYDSVARHLLYVQGNGKLMTRRLELNPLQLVGDPAVVAEEIGVGFGDPFANFSVSGSGTLFYGRKSGTDKMRFGWRDRKGQLLQTIGVPMDNSGMFRLSPDQSRVAYSSDITSSDIWMLELARDIGTRLTFSGAQKTTWSPDGRFVYYRNRNGIYRKAADASGDEEPVIQGTAEAYPQSISPDGNILLFGARDVFVLPLTGERKPKPFLQSGFSHWDAQFSPDGRHVAYFSDESGRLEVYVREFPDRQGKKWQASDAGGRWNHWRADGKELYWIDPDNTLMAASVEVHPTGLRIGRAEPLFRVPLTEGYTDYQPARDGRRFLVREPEPGQRPDRPMVVIQNYAAAIK